MPITSLLFVHTARRYYRLNDLSEDAGDWLVYKFPVRMLFKLGHLEEVKVVTRFP